MLVGVWLLIGCAVEIGCGDNFRAPDEIEVDAAVGTTALVMDAPADVVLDSTINVSLDAYVDDEPDRVPLVFVFAGESNSGGIALNIDATESELRARSSVKILDPANGFVFEDLDIGYNNLIDHAGISDRRLYVPGPPHIIAVHGMELGLANAVEAGAFRGHDSVYLIKTGQGGSTIANWDVGGAYWTKFLQRINAAKSQLPAEVRWIVWYSQGINDAHGTFYSMDWKDRTRAHLAKIKAELPGCRIILTEFQAMVINGGYSRVNTAIEQLVAEDPDLASVLTTGASTLDPNHWSYAGFRGIVVPALVSATVSKLASR